MCEGAKFSNPRYFQVEIFGRDLAARTSSFSANMGEWKVLATRVAGSTFVADNLETDKMYTFLVRAENSHGLSAPSQLSEPLTLNGAVVADDRIFESTIEDRQTREARALLQSGHTAELIDIQSVNSTSIKLMWEVGAPTAALEECFARSYTSSVRNFNNRRFDYAVDIRVRRRRRILHLFAMFK